MVRKVILSFPAEITGKALTYELVKIFDIHINIIKAAIEVGKSGKLLMELDADEEVIAKGISYLEENGVTVSPVASKISYNEKKCIHCGNCASACYSEALTITPPEWKLNFNPEKCTICKLCLKSCPLQLFKIEFSE
jgi:ferredoxin